MLRSKVTYYGVKSIANLFDLSDWNKTKNTESEALREIISYNLRKL